MPYYIWKTSKEWYEHYERVDVRIKYQQLFSDFKKENLFALRYILVFMLRRYIIVITCILAGFLNIPAFYYL